MIDKEMESLALNYVWIRDKYLKAVRKGRLKLSESQAMRLAMDKALYRALGSRKVYGDDRHFYLQTIAELLAGARG